MHGYCEDYLLRCSRTFLKKTTREDANRASNIILKIGEAASSNTYPDMSKSADKLRKRYIYHPKGKSKPTCLIHGPGNSSDECRVLGDFGSKYAKIRPTKDRGHYTKNINKINRHK